MPQRKGKQVDSKNKRIQLRYGSTACDCPKSNRKDKGEKIKVPLKKRMKIKRERRQIFI